MEVTGLSHLTIQGGAETIEACVSFYRSLLNLRIGFRPPLNSSGYWLYAGEQDLVHLLITDADAPSAPAPLAHIAFACINLPVTIQRLEDLAVDYYTNHLPDIGQFQIFTTDPAGINIELNFSCEQISHPHPSGPEPTKRE